MKVRIHYTVDVDAGVRRAIVHYYGDNSRRLATRKEVQDWFETYGYTMDDDLSDAHSVCCIGETPKDQP